jgi:phage tail protein X
LIFAGTHGRGVKAHLSPVSEVSHAGNVATADPRSSFPAAVASPSGNLRPHESPRADARDSSSNSFGYVVQPRDTIRDLCMSTFGRYDVGILAKIRKLNPGLKNPNVLEVGQEIRLPLSSQEQAASGSSSR